MSSPNKPPTKPPTNCTPGHLIKPDRGKIYVAGPYTFSGEGKLATYAQRDLNVQRAARIAERLRKAGWTPFLPHSLYSGWNEALCGLIFEGRAGYTEVMIQCLRWIELCDALIRLPGYSPGSDFEAAHATQRGIPVYSPADMPELVRRA